jgi:hypothetical protein
MSEALATVPDLPQVAERGWAGIRERDQQFLDILADEVPDIFSDGQDIYERACLMLAMGRPYRRLYRELSPARPLSRHGGKTATMFARLWQVDATRDYIMELRRRNRRDMMDFLDENAPLMHDVLERALQGDEDVTKMQVDVAFRLFHQRYGRPTQRIAHEHSGGITHEHLQDSEQSLVAAFAAVRDEPLAIIDTEAIEVEPIEPVVGADEGPGHATVHPEPRALAGDTG